MHSIQLKLSEAPACLIMLHCACGCRYGFVKFMTKEGANKAMQELHQTEMPAFPNMKVGGSLPY